MKCPNKYAVKGEPVSLRLVTLETLNTSIQRGTSNLSKRYIEFRKRSVIFPGSDIKTTRRTVLTTILTGNMARLCGYTGRPRIF